MTDEERLVEALKALGYERVLKEALNTVVGRRNDGGQAIQFSRSTRTAPYSTPSGTSAAALSAVQRKYTEIGVREWARRNGYAVARAENDGKRLTLVNRRK
jgi:hypothetical protein